MISASAHESCCSVSTRTAILVVVLDNDECDADQHQHDSHDNRVVQMRIQPIIKKQTDDRGRDTGHDDLEPHLEYIIAQKRTIFVLEVERKDLMPVKNDHSKNGAQLDNDQEHIPK